MMESMDRGVGAVLAAIARAGIEENTLVVFTSDNGADWKISDKGEFAHRANAEWRGEKADIHEGGHRIPYLVRWPGKVKAGSVSREPGCLTDFFATAAEMVDFALPVNAAEDSFSLLPAYFGSAGKPIREAVVHHSMDGMFSIRKGDWKLMLGLGSGGFTPPRREDPKPGGPAGQLYNLADDPGETRNLYVAEPRIVRELSALLEKYQKQGFSRRL
jgi:arylsulfatase A-like enzyme